mmetsp:Transcript_11600/g.21115  ORF Transcript_11600/g.21115 Transcript_11600/m.21115 type:complete len:207 (-) Transcript_11600:55-675(-)
MLVCEIEWVCVELFWFYLDNGFDFDGHVEGEGIGSNGTSGMVSDGFSKDFHNDVGTSVHDQVLTLEVGGGVDNAKYFDDLFDAVEVTEVFLESGNDAEATETGGLISFVNIRITHHTRHECPIVHPKRQMSRDIQHVSRRTTHNVIIGPWCRRFRQCHAQLLQPFFHMHLPPRHTISIMTTGHHCHYLRLRRCRHPKTQPLNSHPH